MRIMSAAAPLSRAQSVDFVAGACQRHRRVPSRKHPHRRWRRRSRLRPFSTRAEERRLAAVRAASGVGRRGSGRSGARPRIARDPPQPIIAALSVQSASGGATNCAPPRAPRPRDRRGWSCWRPRPPATAKAGRSGAAGEGRPPSALRALTTRQSGHCSPGMMRRGRPGRFPSCRPAPRRCARARERQRVFSPENDMSQPSRSKKRAGQGGSARGIPVHRLGPRFAGPTRLAEARGHGRSCRTPRPERRRWCRRDGGMHRVPKRRETGNAPPDTRRTR